ncbi:hypothetical protein [Gymnodinialimonas sp.]
MMCPEDTERWTFNIVYTAGTVMYFLPFLKSLLAHDSAQFRLIDNGCLPPEKRALEDFANQSPRLSLLSLSETACRSHGEILDALIDVPTSGPFCFMDSDIIATGAFSPALADALCHAPAVFSAEPIWLPDGDGVFQPPLQSLTGEYIRNNEGGAVGCTYCAVFDREALRAVTDAYGVSFEHITWSELSGAVQTELVHRGRRAKLYDTAKLATAFLDGPRHITLPSLHHIGGSSFEVRRTKQKAARSSPLRVPVLKHLRATAGYLRFGGIREAHRTAYRRLNFRDPVREYLLDLTKALATETSEPPIPITPSESVNRKMAAGADAIRSAWALP